MVIILVPASASPAAPAHENRDATIVDSDAFPDGTPAAVVEV